MAIQLRIGSRFSDVIGDCRVIYEVQHFNRQRRLWTCKIVNDCDYHGHIGEFEGVVICQALAQQELLREMFGAPPVTLDAEVYSRTVAVLREIADDPKGDLVDSERRMRLYYVLNELAGM